MSGIGISSIFSSIVIAAYYSTIIAWALYWFCLSFRSPIPWSEAGMMADGNRKCLDISPAEEFYSRIALEFRKENCEVIEPGDTDHVVWYIFLSNTVAWFIIFLCVVNGVKSSSYIVWFTVPIPVILIFVMIIKGSQLDGASDGISNYLNGEAGVD
jgi:SNF family Na+-dependent transporter